MPIGKPSSDGTAVVEGTPLTLPSSPSITSGYKGRDFEAEARGKVACVAFNAALASPGIAGLSFTNIDEYLALVRKAADASVAYTWEKQK